MKRLLSALATATAVAAVTVIAAPVAHADVTNPADNPHKIVVQGDDGNTYTDGQDTLPGYDDYECTYIPGAWFDFAKNRVYYADGSWIPWTEWDRATGYKEWLAKQKETSASGGTKTDTKSGTKTGTKSGTKTTTKSGTKTETKTTTKSGTAAGTASDDKTVDDAKAEPSVTPSALPTDSASAEPSPSVSFSAAPFGDDVDYASETSPEAVVADGEGPAAPGNGAGLLILGGLAAAGALTYGGYTLAKGGWRKGSPQ